MQQPNSTQKTINPPQLISDQPSIKGLGQQNDEKYAVIYQPVPLLKNTSSNFLKYAPAMMHNINNMDTQLENAPRGIFMQKDDHIADQLG